MKKKAAMVALLSLTLASSGSVYANANSMTGSQMTNQSYTGTATTDGMRSNTNYSSYGNNYNGYSNNGTTGTATGYTNRYRATATDNRNNNWGWLGLLGLLGLAGMRNRSREKH